MLPKIKKTQTGSLDLGNPFFIHKIHRVAPLRGGFSPVQAGLLTLGSSYVPRLPIPLAAGQWHFAVFVPDNSGGPVLDSNEVPY